MSWEVINKPEPPKHACLVAFAAFTAVANRYANGSIWRCDTCGQRWRWTSNGFTRAL